MLLLLDSRTAAVCESSKGKGMPSSVSVSNKSWGMVVVCRPDVDVITANPKTAGVARWNFFALWGHKLDKGDAAALDFTTKVITPSALSCY